MLRITQGKGGEGRATRRQKAVEKQEGEKRGITLERMVKLDLLSLLCGVLQRNLELAPLWGFFPI